MVRELIQTFRANGHVAELPLDRRTAAVQTTSVVRLEHSQTRQSRGMVSAMSQGPAASFLCVRS